MSSRAIRAGQTIKLRSRFRDDLGDNAEAGSVFVHIFEPDTDVLDLSEATVVSGIPTFLGEGIFELEFLVPSAGPGGTWTDKWEAVLTGQPLSGLFNFHVSTAGIVVVSEHQLFLNDLVQITITSGVMDLDGVAMEEDYDFEFMTTTSPSYANLRKIRLEIGGFLGDLPDDTIQTAILEASIEGDVFTFAPGRVNDAVFEHARRQYVTCAASLVLLSNLTNQLLRTKSLGDLHVEYDTNGIKNSMNRIVDCMDKWLPQLTAGGGARAAKNPAFVVKGALDPDRPIVSRMWQSTDDGGISRRIPAANTSVRQSTQRRHKRTYLPGKKLW